MGRVKAMIMDQEEIFWGKAYNLIGECESFQEFEGTMYQNHYDLIDHYGWDDIYFELKEFWADFWGKYQ